MSSSRLTIKSCWIIIPFCRETLELQAEFDDLCANYTDVCDAFELLLEMYDDLENEFTGYMLMIELQPLIDKMSFYYQCCRFACFDHTTDESMAQSAVDLFSMEVNNTLPLQ